MFRVRVGRPLCLDPAHLPLPLSCQVPAARDAALALDFLPLLLNCLQAREGELRAAAARALGALLGGLDPLPSASFADEALRACEWLALSAVDASPLVRREVALSLACVAYVRQPLYFAAASAFPRPRGAGAGEAASGDLRAGDVGRSCPQSITPPSRPPQKLTPSRPPQVVAALHVRPRGPQRAG